MNVISSVNLVTSKWLFEYSRAFIGGKVLDVGCGHKPYKRLYNFDEWVGLDARPVGDIQVDICATQFEPEYDSVFCVHLLQYVNDPMAAIRNMVTALKPDGHLVLVTVNTFQEDNACFWNFKVRGLDWMVNSVGLKPVLIQSGGSLFTDESENYRSTDKYSVPLPQTFPGWIEFLDKAYPSLSFVIARKE